MRRQDSHFNFYRPFHETRSGQIISLANRLDPMRDGLAVVLLARHFPVSGYDGIAVEPSRPALHPAGNVILVGSSELFVKPDAHPWSGQLPPLVVGEDKLGDRLRNIKDGCCLRFRNGNGRWLWNSVTGEKWGPKGELGSPFREDYGVIRRLFRAPFENTIIVEGVQRLGTLGAAKVATSTVALDAVWDAVRRLPDFDESRPLEVLVRATFHDEAGQCVYSVDAVQATPLLVVYDRQWVFDLNGTRQWHDQLPWPVHLVMRGDEWPIPVEGVVTDRPRLELEADLRGADEEFRERCRALFGAPLESIPPVTVPDVALERVLEMLPRWIDRFQLALVEEPPLSSQGRRLEIPRGHSRIRKLRKLFLVHLILRRLRARRLHVDEAAVHRFFPDFRGGESAKPFVSQFIGAVPSRLREGFEALLGEASRPKEHVRIEYGRREAAYALHLDRATQVVRLRL